VNVKTQVNGSLSPSTPLHHLQSLALLNTTRLTAYNRSCKLAIDWSPSTETRNAVKWYRKVSSWMGSPT